MSRIAIALPYAVSIRDFVHNGSLGFLVSQSKHRCVIYTMNPDLPEFELVRSLGVDVRLLRPHVDGLAEKLLKVLYPLFFSDKFAYVHQMLQDRPVRRWISKLFVLLRRILGTRRILSVWSKVLLIAYRLRALSPQLNEPYDLLIGTRSLINSLDYGLIAEATLRSIPVFMIAGSWDNFTTKGFFPFPAPQTVVWNRKMRQELIELFDVSADCITIAGYPRAPLLQAGRYLVSPAAYLSEIGIQGFRRFILYSASYGELTRADTHSMPIEYEAIRVICEQLTPQLPSDTCILIRMHPFSNADDQAYFSSLSRCFVFVPGRQDRYIERVMSTADESHLAQQIDLAVCVISMASTMTIDTLCLNRPILNIAFDPIIGLKKADSLTRFYEFNHFFDLVRLVNLPLAHTVQDVMDFVNQCLDGCYQSPVDIDKFHEWYLDGAVDSYPATLSQAVDKVLVDYPSLVLLSGQDV